jgi:hypothetical protein
VKYDESDFEMVVQEPPKPRKPPIVVDGRTVVSKRARFCVHGRILKTLEAIGEPPAHCGTCEFEREHDRRGEVGEEVS